MLLIYKHVVCLQQFTFHTILNYKVTQNKSVLFRWNFTKVKDNAIFKNLALLVTSINKYKLRNFQKPY